jgi:tripartite-type tricarboxylate transporter receptor subunit TctC
VPTVAEAGVPGYEASVWFGVFAPAGTPAPVVAKLNEEIARALNTADLRGRFNAMGTDVSGMGPAEFQSFVRKEVPKWAEVVKKANVQIN